MILRLFHLVMALVILPIAFAAGSSHANGNRDWETYNGWEVKTFALEGMPEEFGRDLQRGLAQTGKLKLIGGMTRPDF